MSGEQKIRIANVVVPVNVTRKELRDAYAKVYAKDPIGEGALLATEALEIARSGAVAEPVTLGVSEVPVDDTVVEDELDLDSDIEAEVSETVTTFSHEV